MSATAYNIPIANITTFLDDEGWKLQEEGDERWYVFSGEVNSDNDSFEIVLPKTTRSPEYPLYVMHMIEILSSLANKSHELIIKDIQNVCRDVLLVRVDGSADARSIPMHLLA